MAAPRELRLEGGQEPEEDEPRERGQSERSQRRHRAEERRQAENIESRLFAVFNRLSDALEGRGDDELAGMIREDTKAMVGGLVSVVRRVPALAAWVVGGLAVLEPLIAFGRIFRLLLRRLGERRREAAEGLELVPEEELYPPAEPVYGAEEPGPAEGPELEVPLAGPDVARPWDLSQE